MDDILTNLKKATMLTWIRVEGTAMVSLGIIIILSWYRQPTQIQKTTTLLPLSAQSIVGKETSQRFLTFGCHRQTGVGLSTMLERQRTLVRPRRSTMTTQKLTLRIRRSTETMLSK